MIAPAAITVRLPVTIEPRSTPLTSVIFTVVPFARTVPKLLLDRVSVIFPFETKLAEPVTIMSPLCEILPVVLTVSEQAEIAPKTKSEAWPVKEITLAESAMIVEPSRLPEMAMLPLPEI